MNPTLLLDDGSLTIECPWRLRNRDGIVLLGSAEYKYEKYRDWTNERFEMNLLNNVITSVELINNASDLAITFQQDLVLEIFHDSSYFEVSTPGGSLSFWEESGEE